MKSVNHVDLVNDCIFNHSHMQVRINKGEIKVCEPCEPSLQCLRLKGEYTHKGLYVKNRHIQKKYKRKVHMVHKVHTGR